MLLWITVGVFVIGIIMGILGHFEPLSGSYAYDILSALVRVTSGVVLALMLGIIALTHIGAESTAATLDQRFKSMVYQAESGAYSERPFVGKYELANDIRKWNEDLASNRALERDYWVGIFIPDIYDNYSFISPNLMDAYEVRERSK